MSTTHRRATAALAAMLFCAGAASVSRAGGFFFSRDDYDRQLQPGAVVPNDGAPFSERYGFYAGSNFYYGTGGYYNNFLYMDYLDRLDRAEKFGYRPPAPPAFLVRPNCGPCGR